jgi:alcohol dehydrogenase class IV
MDGVRWVASLCRQLEVPPLRTYGVQNRHIPMLVGAARQTSSMKGNPIALTDQELTEILDCAI